MKVVEGFMEQREKPFADMFACERERFLFRIAYLIGSHDAVSYLMSRTEARYDLAGVMKSMCSEIIALREKNLADMKEHEEENQ